MFRILFFGLVAAFSRSQTTEQHGYDQEDLVFMDMLNRRSLKRRSLQQEMVSPEQYRYTTPGFDPSGYYTDLPGFDPTIGHEGCVNLAVPEKGALSCEDYAALNLCNFLQSDEYCKKSCNKCCIDVEVPGTNGGCTRIVEERSCNTPQILGKYCRKSCNFCKTQQSIWSEPPSQFLPPPSQIPSPPPIVFQPPSQLAPTPVSISGCVNLAVPDKGALSCEDYAASNLCDILQGDEYCRKSCNRCCIDVEVAGIAGGCTSIVERGSCNTTPILGKYCQKSCGFCKTELSQEEALEAFSKVTGFNGSVCTNQTNGHCYEIDLTGEDLSGTLAPELSVLTDLKKFDVCINSMQGTLPPHYSRWVNVEYVNLHENEFSGTLPPHYSRWVNVEYVNLYENEFSGTLPLQYSNWQNVEHVDFDQNSLTGTLPPQYSNWQNVGSAYFFRNSLTGTLPPHYSRWADDALLQVSNNSLTGQIPIEYTSIDSVYTEPQNGDGLCVSNEVESQTRNHDFEDLPRC